MADPTLVEVTLRLSPAALEAISVLVDAEVDSVIDLANDNSQAHSPKFLRELREIADHWECLRAPLRAARLKLRSSIATSGTINTRGGK